MKKTLQQIKDELNKMKNDIEIGYKVKDTAKVEHIDTDEMIEIKQMIEDIKIINNKK